MKKNYLITLIGVFLLLVIVQQVKAQGFVHPGALHTQEDFDRIKAQLGANESRVKQGYSKLTSNSFSSSTYSPSPQTSVVRGGTGENYAAAMRDAAAAYQNALRWKIEGTTANADKAIEILNAWARTCKVVTGDTNYALGAGFYGYAFANAGELMRDYEGWKQSDFVRFQNWMRDVFFPANYYFLSKRNGTDEAGYPAHYWSNWGLCNVLSVISIGILCDDPYIYNWGISYYKYDLKGTFINYVDPASSTVITGLGYTEFLGNTVPAVYSDNTAPYGYIGQMQEAGRDQGHCLLSIGLAADVCQVGWNQGDDLFSHMDNRLAAGIEYQAAHAAKEAGLIDASSVSLPWTTYVRRYYNNQTDTHTGISSGYGGDRPYWDRIIGHYEGIKGVEMTYAKKIRDKMGIDGGGGHYGSTSGGFDHLGFTTLTCTRPAVSKADAPIALKPVIIYSSKNYERGELNNITHGSSVVFSPQLPADVTDNGSWQWESGETTRELTITANNSGIYRVYYTHDNGVKSSQLFSIAVTGDWSGDTLTPVVTVGEVEYNDTVVYIIPRTTFTLEVRPAIGSGQFKWANASTASSREVKNLGEDRSYSVDYTDIGGKNYTVNFHIKMTIITPALKVDNGALQEINTVIVNAGQSVLLSPKVQAGKDGGSWSWSNGSTEATMSLENIQTSGTYSVKYVYDDVEYNLNYDVYVAENNKQMEVGDYFIKDAATGLYLTNDGTAIPCFEDAVFTEDSIAQMWTISKDGTRYKIVSLKDGRYVNEHCKFGTNDYFTSWNSYTFHGIIGGDLYAIQNGGDSGTDYWTTNGFVVTGKGSSTMQGYPFEIIRKRTAAISSVNSAYIPETATVYPNPVEEILQITVPEDLLRGKTAFNLYSLNGILVKSMQCYRSNEQLNVSDLSEGIYIGVLSSDGLQKNFKIIKK